MKLPAILILPVLLGMTATTVAEVPQSAYHKFRDYNTELEAALKAEDEGRIDDGLHHYQQALWMFSGVAVPGEKRIYRILSAYFPYVMRNYGPQALESYAAARAQ